MAMRKRILRNSHAVALVLALLVGGRPEAAAAEEVRLFSPPSGLWLRGTDAQDEDFYGPTAEAADWFVSQWNNPGQRLPPFAPRACAQGACFSTIDADGDARVDVDVDAAGFLRYGLSQNGAGLPCRREDGPRAQEFDLFVANKTRFAAGLQQQKADRVPLGAMHALRMTVDVAPLHAVVRDTGRCRTNMGKLLVAVVLRNEAARPRQTLFYQLRVFKIGVDPRPNWWREGSERELASGAKVASFGFGDNLDSYGVDDPALGARTRLDIDLLPRLRTVIASGEHGLDPDPDRWHIVSTYHGSHIWGDTELRSEWSGFSLKARIAK